MKVSCWADGLVIKAENEQDAFWLTNFISGLDNKDILSGHVEINIGEFDCDNELKIFSDDFDLRDFPKNNDGYIFVETDPEHKSGKEGQVVEITFRNWNNLTDECFGKILKRKLKELSYSK